MQGPREKKKEPAHHHHANAHAPVYPTPERRNRGQGLLVDSTIHLDIQAQRLVLLRHANDLFPADHRVSQLLCLRCWRLVIASCSPLCLLRPRRMIAWWCANYHYYQQLCLFGSMHSLRLYSTVACWGCGIQNVHLPVLCCAVWSSPIHRPLTAANA